MIENIINPTDLSWYVYYPAIFLPVYLFSCAAHWVFWQYKLNKIVPSEVQAAYLGGREYQGTLTYTEEERKQRVEYMTARNWSLVWPVFWLVNSAIFIACAIGEGAQALTKWLETAGEETGYREKQDKLQDKYDDLHRQLMSIPTTDTVTGDELRLQAQLKALAPHVTTREDTRETWAEKRTKMMEDRQKLMEERVAQLKKQDGTDHGSTDEFEILPGRWIH